MYNEMIVNEVVDSIFDFLKKNITNEFCCSNKSLVLLFNKFIEFIDNKITESLMERNIEKNKIYSDIERDDAIKFLYKVIVDIYDPLYINISSIELDENKDSNDYSFNIYLYDDEYPTEILHSSNLKEDITKLDIMYLLYLKDNTIEISNNYKDELLRVLTSNNLKEYYSKNSIPLTSASIINKNFKNIDMYGYKNKFDFFIMHALNTEHRDFNSNILEFLKGLIIPVHVLLPDTNFLDYLPQDYLINYVSKYFNIPDLKQQIEKGNLKKYKLKSKKLTLELYITEVNNSSIISLFYGDILLLWQKN